MAACRSAIERKTPRRCAAGPIDSTTAWPGRSRLREEAEIGVKWKVQRG
jgi:hypothetical protein